MMNQENLKTAIVLGAGPAGLAAALELVQKDYRVTVFERDEVVGGISRTTEYHGYRFDMGGHRFFTKNREVEAWWHAALKSDFQRTPRLSRIYYNRRFFRYPIAIKDALKNAGLGPALLWFLSFLRYKIKPIRPEKSFADWVTNRFGKRLFETFFKSYTEKVWGIPTTELSAEWAVQRIKGLSLWEAIRNALVQSKAKETSLIEEFNYPKYGPGMMYEAVAAQVEAAGGTILTGHHVSGLRHQDGKVVGVEVTRAGVQSEHVADVVVSTIPLPDTLSLLFPGQPEVEVTARNMRFRDFISVNLILDQPEVFPDTWIYVHDPTVKLGTRSGIHRMRSCWNSRPRNSKPSGWGAMRRLKMAVYAGSAMPTRCTRDRIRRRSPTPGPCCRDSLISRWPAGAVCSVTTTWITPSFPAGWRRGTSWVRTAVPGTPTPSPSIMRNANP